MTHLSGLRWFRQHRFDWIIHRTAFLVIFLAWNAISCCLIFRLRWLVVNKFLTDWLILTVIQWRHCLDHLNHHFSRQTDEMTIPEEVSDNCSSFREIVTMLLANTSDLFSRLLISISPSDRLRFSPSLWRHWVLPEKLLIVLWTFGKNPSQGKSFKKSESCKGWVKMFFNSARLSGPSPSLKIFQLSPDPFSAVLPSW